MTPVALRQALLARKTSWPADDDDLLGAVEREAEAHPGDPGWTTLLLATDLLHSAPKGVPVDLIRGQLVRADGLSATWTARDADGQAFLVRVPRPSLTPAQRRLLERDMRALQPLVDGLQWVDGCAVAPLPGAPVEGPLPPQDAIRFVATALGEFGRWQGCGFGPMPPTPYELREIRGRAVWVSLTPGPLRLDALTKHLAFTLRPTGSLAPFMRGLIDLPPESLDDAKTRLIRALRADLSERAVALQQTHLLTGHTRRRERLEHALERLQNALPPPEGHSSVGFDLDGLPTFVTATCDAIHWGSEGNEKTLWRKPKFDAPEARRLLRACAVAPLSTQSPDTDGIGRWIAAGLRLRTLRMLLERTG